MSVARYLLHIANSCSVEYTEIIARSAHHTEGIYYYVYSTIYHDTLIIIFGYILIIPVVSDRGVSVILRWWV